MRKIMTNQNNEYILKEGYNIILTSLLVSFIVDIFISDGLANIFYLLVFLLLFIYRNPSRVNYLAKDDDILAPIDGKVIAIDKSKNKQKIYIDVSLCNSHVLRTPINSKYKLKSLKNGLNLNSNTFKAKKLNAQAILKFDDIKIKLISGIYNSKLNFKDSQHLNAGENIGIFLQGLIIIEIPNNYKLNININDNIYSKSTIQANNTQ